MVLDSDVLAVGTLADVAKDGEQELGEGWDNDLCQNPSKPPHAHRGMG